MFLYLSSGKYHFPEFQVRLCFLKFCLGKESQVKCEKRVEGSKGTLLPGLGLAFGLSKIG
jgi:hypothetical protein